MTSLLQIAASGVAAAAAQLNTTSQNIANASTTGYVRETVSTVELANTSSMGTVGTASSQGVMVTGIHRNVDTYLQSEARRTNSDAARADALVTGLTAIDNSVENSNVYSTITSFESALTALAANPTNSSLRSNVVSTGATMAQSFNEASSALSQTMSGLQSEAGAGVSQINTLATNLAQLNQRISADTDPANDSAALYNQRDTLLQQLSNYADITSTLSANGTVSVAMGGSSPQSLVTATGGTSTLTTTTASDGTISFALGGTPITVAGGSLAGQQQALASGAGNVTSLNTIAKAMITAANTAQTGGVDLNGTAGTAMFSGSGANDIAMALTSGAQVVTAAAGSVANSQNATQLTSLSTALAASNGPAAQMNDLYFATSSAVSTNTTTQTTLDAIAANAKTQLANSAGVNLDTEAANLVQFQQAYQASAKVIQVASDLFSQILQIS